MNKSMWNSEAVKAYESGQGVVLVEKPYPHYEPKPQALEDHAIAEVQRMGQEIQPEDL